MDILEGLNPEQKAAVTHVDGPLLVVAGAGTGKTQVITRRIASIIAAGKAKPSEVLALTFTEKAAREMQDRLHGLIGWQSFQVPVMTFHAFGTELLSRFASHVGRSVRGGLLNDTQKTLLLQQHLDHVQLTYYGTQTNLFEFLEGVVGYIGNLQNAGVTLDSYRAYVAGLDEDPGLMHPRDVDEQRDLLKLYELYESVKAEAGAFDYNDQLQLPLQILKQRPNIAQRLAAEYRYVLVDEYQDTNAIQDQLLRTFIGPEGNLFAVGDDDQAIYGFRGAEIGNILGFVEHFRVAQAAVLMRNYRSGQAILDCAYRLIGNNNPERLEAKLGINKRLVGLHDDSTVEFVPYKSASDEQEGILAAIESRLAAGEKPITIAVLAATHAPLKAIAKTMRRRDIPFALSTSVNIFEQPELIALWYLLKWIAMAADDEAIGHVIMGPMIGWTAHDYRHLRETAHEEMASLEDVLRADDSELSHELVQKLDEWRDWARDIPVSQLAFRLVFDGGRAEMWRQQAEASPRMIRVFEDLQRLLDQMQDFETVAFDTTVFEYLRTFPKPPVLEVTEPTGDIDGVQLLTVHASKGLEFETVYLMGCTQRSWSGTRTPVRKIPDELRTVTSDLPPEHEFRRLMYVAVTRARQSLVVSAATQTAAGSRQPITPFISELFGEEASKREPRTLEADKLGKALDKLQQFYPMKSAYDKPTLPFEDGDGWLNLSITTLGSYEYCPFEFYLENVLQIRQPAGPQMAFGTALHRVFEAYYKAQLSGGSRSPEELHAVLDEAWSEKGYEHKDIAEADRKLAHTTLDKFIAREARTDRKIIGSEIPIRLEIPEARLKLRGKIDAFFETADGLELRDFKTGRTKTDPERLAKDAKDNFQLRSYALAYEILNGQAPARVSLDYVVTETEGVATLSAAILRNHRVKLGSIADRIRAHDFAPNPSPMHTCAAYKYYGTGEVDELTEHTQQNKAAS